MSEKYSHTDKEQDKTILGLIRNVRTFERGFRLLVQTFKERLYWHIRQRVNLHDYTDEILQNTFIKVYKGLKNFRGDSKLYTWLYRIASNETFTFMKKQQKHATDSIDTEDNYLAQTLKADNYFDGDQAQIILRKAIASLPEKQGKVFAMRYFEDMSYKEIAEVLETSVGALKASYHHAVKKIEAYVKNAL